MKYKAFISYRHSDKSRDQAICLESALKRYAKPLLRPPLRIFRDEQILRPGDDLPWGIRRTLTESEYLIYLATKEATESPWVVDELRIWCEELKRTDKLIIVHIDDRIEVDHIARSIDWQNTDALPIELRPHLVQSIPIYADLTRATQNHQRDLNDPEYKQIINRIAAQLHGTTPEAMNGEEILTHRRNLRLRNLATGAVILFALAALLGAYIANEQRKVAEHQRQIARARQLAAPHSTNFSGKS